MASTINADTTNGVVVTSDTSGEIKLQSAGADTVTVKSDGKVGIGTSSPATDLVVNTTGVQGLQLTDISTDSSPRLLFTNDTNTWTIYNNVEDLSFRSGATIGSSSGTERMRIDSSGRVTMTAQPAFLATKNTTNFSTTGGGVKIPFDYTVFNTGNHFNTSTNTFTCPISGKYLFIWQGYQNGSQSLRMDLYKNGARYVGGYNSPTANSGTSSSVLLDAAANDTVYLTLESATTTLYYGGVNPHTYLTGYLLG